MTTKKPAKGADLVRRTRKPMPEHKAPPTDKRDAFVAAYMGEARMNATLAATIAGYSPDSAHGQGSRLLDEPDVIAKIDAIKVKRRAEQETRAREIGEILFETAMGRTIATVGVSEGVPIMGEPKHADRTRAGELFLKMNGSLIDKLEVTTTPATSEALRRAADERARVEQLEAQLRERGSE